VLIAVFALVGVAIYQVTAPPLAPGQQGFSLGRIVQNVRRGIVGHSAHAVVQTSRSEAIDASVAEVRVNVRILDLVVVGEDRADAAFELKVDSNGTDEADAKRLATATTLTLDRAGTGLLVSMDFPKDGIQRATLTIRMPKRLGLRVENKVGRFEVTGVASIDVKGNRGESRVSDVTGEVALNHRGGALNVDGAGSLRLNAAGASGVVTHIKGAASVELTGSDLTLNDIAGPLDVKARGTDLKLRKLDTLKPPLRLDMQSGSVDAEGLHVETRIDGRDTEMRIGLDRAAPVTIYNTGEDITITPPSGGYTLDAIATDGEISIDDGGLKPTGDDREQRIVGAVRGGGPTLALRATRGHITVKSRPSGK